MLHKNFTPFPILKTERLTLRQLSGDDRQSIFALRSNPEVNKYLDRVPSRTIDDALKFINVINENIEKNNSIYWVATLTGTNTIVGTICLFNFSDEADKCEIGYELQPEFQEQGLMKEATEAVITYAFEIIDAQAIEAFTHNGNVSSTKLLKKLGFVQSSQADKENPDFTIFILNR